MKIFKKKYIKGNKKGFILLRHHPFIVPVLTFLVLFGLTAAVFVLTGGESLKLANSHSVIVTHDRVKQTVPTQANNVGELLKKLNIVLNEGDIVEPAVDFPILEDNFRINVYRAHPVTIVDGDRKVLAFNAAATPRSIAAKAGITVYAEDGITSQPSDDIINEAIIEKIVIDRAVAVNLNLYGTPVTIRSHANTVGDILTEKNVKLAKDDVVSPNVTTPITSEIQVFVTRNGTQISTIEEIVGFETQTVDDSSLSFGTTAVRQNGVEGKKLVTYQINLVNGVEASRVKIQEVTALTPINRIIARGRAISIPADKTEIMAAAGIAPSDYPYVYYIINHENALWCPTRWQGQFTCPSYYAEKYPGAETVTTLGYGLCQSTPAIKMSSAGADWRTNVVTQMRWCTDYAMRRYGTWEAAYNYWVAHRNW